MPTHAPALRLPACSRTPHALVRALSPRFAEGELTHLPRVPVDLARAEAEHAAYVACIAAHGFEVLWLPALPDAPDGVFVEDLLVVLDDTLVVTRPGAASRRAEVPSVQTFAAASGRAVHTLEAPGTLDGGDVLVLPGHVLVGASSRTNDAGFTQLAPLCRGSGRVPLRVPIQGVLHLKSAVTALPDGALIAAPAHVDTAALAGLGYRVHHALEPSGADVLCLGPVVVLPESAPRTVAALRGQGYTVETLALGELGKLESGVTCMSVLLRPARGAAAPLT
jgi:dimethylargininase